MFYQSILEQITAAIQRLERIIGLRKDTIVDDTLFGKLNSIPLPICEKLTIQNNNTFITTHKPYFMGAWCINDMAEISVDNLYTEAVNNIQYVNGVWYITADKDYSTQTITITYFYTI